MSGYTHTGWKDVLNNAEYTKMAAKICHTIGHRTDNFNASHVEKQLIAYYINHHVILERNEELKLKRSQPLQANGNTVNDCAEEMDIARVDELMSLRAVMPVHSKPYATITVSKTAMCPDCQIFIGKALEKFNLPIKVSCVGNKIRTG